MKQSLFREIPRNKISFISDEEAFEHYSYKYNISQSTVLNSYNACLITHTNHENQNIIKYDFWIYSGLVKNSSLPAHLAFRHEMIHLLRTQRKAFFSKLSGSESRLKLSIGTFFEELITVFYTYRGLYLKIIICNPILKTISYFYNNFSYPFLEAFLKFKRFKK